MGHIKLRWNKYLILLICVGGVSIGATSPDKKQFEQDRKDLLQRIKTINQILQQTTSKKKVNTGQLTALNKKIETNNLLIGSLTQEIKSTNRELGQQAQKIQTLQTELVQLKKEYAQILFWGSKSMRHINTLVFIFSADTFQALLQRLRATKQYVKIRREHFEEIKKVDLQLQIQRIGLEKKAHRKKLLLDQRQAEQVRLHGSKQKQHQIIGKLEQQQGELVKELRKQNEAVKHLDKLISDIVKKEIVEAAAAEEAASRSAAASSSSNADIPSRMAFSPATNVLSQQFAQYQGKLPWPVKSGFISNKFGRRSHPVFKNVQIENLGIDIQTEERATVYAIFTGVVKTISFVPGMNQVVIMQHGKYHTVYAKLGAVQVKVGQEVQMGEPIGVVCTDKNGISELQLQIWKALQKLNPALWLSKQPG
jgi:septal ring factor EnvC (AmiA/AmiB activator)